MMTDGELREAYRQMLEPVRQGGREGCPPPEAILALVERSGAEEARLGTLDHVMACSRCRQEMELLRAVVGQAQKETPVRRPLRWAPRNLAWAASLVLTLGVGSLWWSARSGESGRVMRGDGDGLALVSPSPEAALEPGDGFVWRALPGAFEYRLEVLDEEGEVVLSAVTRDTVLVPQEALTAGGEGELRWWVSARMDDGTTRTSELRTLAPGR